MRKFFLILAGLTVLFGIHETAIDIYNRDFNFYSFLVILFLALVVAVLLFLAWLFDGKSPVTRAGEQAQNIVKKQQEKQEEIQTYSPALRRRMWKFRLVSLALIAIAVWICFAGNWQEIPATPPPTREATP